MSVAVDRFRDGKSVRDNVRKGKDKQEDDSRESKRGGFFDGVTVNAKVGDGVEGEKEVGQETPVFEGASFHGKKMHFAKVGLSVRHVDLVQGVGNVFALDGFGGGKGGEVGFHSVKLFQMCVDGVHEVRVRFHELELNGVSLFFSRGFEVVAVSIFAVFHKVILFFGLFDAVWGLIEFGPQGLPSFKRIRHLFIMMVCRSFGQQLCVLFLNRVKFSLKVVHGCSIGLYFVRVQQMDLDDTLKQISDLQSTENDLYKALTKNAERVALGKQNTFTDSEVQDITDQINSLSASRVNLYNTLSETYKAQSANATIAKDTQQKQMRTLRLLERELNKSKVNLSKLKDHKLNQLKMVEINTYFSKMYDGQRRLFRGISISAIVMFISFVFDHIGPLKIFATPLFILGALGGSAFVAVRVINMMMRRGDNYDEYLWPTAPTTQDQLSGANSDSTSIVQFSSELQVPYVCASSLCCGEGTVWTDASGCVVNTAK